MAKIISMNDAAGAERAYGRLIESIHVAGYTLERSFARLTSLLESGDWRTIDPGYDDINEFLDSIHAFDNFRVVAEKRKKIVQLIKQETPKAQNTKIAKMLGVDEKTVRNDSEPTKKKPRKNKATKASSSEKSEPADLSGTQAARTVARAGRIKNQQEVVGARVAKVAFDAQALGRFSVILADPPWDDEFGRSDRSIENHYPTMALDEILALPVADIAHSQAMLFLWATPSMIEMALQASERWGFEYRTQLIWAKPSIGLGKYVRQRHEILLIGRRGEHPAPAPQDLPDSVTEAPRGEHSAKPEVFHAVIEQMYPSAARIELFRRGAPRAGWAAWGAEVQAEAAE